MLILARKKNQSIMIGDDIEIMVTDISGDCVKLGINAPRHISVHRKEIYEAIKRENESAAKVKESGLSRLSMMFQKLGKSNER